MSIRCRLHLPTLRVVLPLFALLFCISCSGGGGGGGDGTPSQSDETATQPGDTTTQPGGTAQVTLAWYASSSPDVEGYKLYYGTESGNYQYVKDVGNTTTYTIPDLVAGARYYFIATAYTSSAESEFSNEVSFIPGN